MTIDKQKLIVKIQNKINELNRVSLDASKEHFSTVAFAADAQAITLVDLMKDVISGECDD